MKFYLVGGYVRDSLLGVADESTEKDYVVTGATEQEMLDKNFVKVGKDFPVFLHPDTKAEYALARFEKKVGSGYKGFEFDASNSITLEEDLYRRDLTINAMAIDPDDDSIIDPFNGQDDLNNGLLRHVSEAFKEDPVRVLRVARFAARFKKYGFKVSHKTNQFMREMVSNDEVSSLTPERVFVELEKSLSYETPSAFFKVLLGCGAYHVIFSDLQVPDKESHENIFTYLDHLENFEPEEKFAFWLSNQDTKDVERFCVQYKTPKAYSDLALLTSKWRTFVQSILDKSDEEVLEFFSRTDAIRRSERFHSLVKIYSKMDIDMKLFESLLEQIKQIDIKSLNQEDIANSLRLKKLEIIQSFLNSTK